MATKAKTKIKEIKVEDQPHVISCLMRAYEPRGRRRRARWNQKLFIYKNYSEAIAGLQTLHNYKTNEFEDDPDSDSNRYKDFKLHTVNEGKAIAIKLIVE